MFDWFVHFSDWFRSFYFTVGGYSISFFDIWLWVALGSILIWAINQFLDL